MSTTLEVSAWEKWNQEREEFAKGPQGPVSLLGTFWISATSQDEAQEIPALPGRWWVASTSVVGSNVPAQISTTGTVQLHPGEFIDAGDNATITALVRQGNFALRVFNPAITRKFAGIATFEPQQHWVIPAVVEEDAALIDVTTVDGVQLPTAFFGWVNFEFNGVQHRLRVANTGTELQVVFGDASAKNGVHPFRFLSIPLPDEQGKTVINFNYSYLSPSAFNPNFLCPTPVTDNYLDFEVEAGEQHAIFADADGA